MIWLDDKVRIVVNAGPGTVRRFKQSGADYSDLQAMLFTHFHVDHSDDFAAYVKGGFFTERHQTLYVFGPSGTESVVSAEQFVERMLGAGSLYPYLGNFLAADARVKKLVLTCLMRRTVDDKEATTKLIRRHYAGPIEFPDDLGIVRLRTGQWSGSGSGPESERGRYHGAVNSLRRRASLGIAPVIRARGEDTVP